MSSLKKIIGFILTINLIWTSVIYIQSYIEQSTEIELDSIIEEEIEIIYINGVKCYRPKKKP